MTTDKNAKVSDMLRFGMVMQMPYDMDQSRFFGRGPIENYSDRKASERIGIYKQTADQTVLPLHPSTGKWHETRCQMVATDQCFGHRT